MIIRLILFLFLAEWILISSFRFVLPPTTLRAASNLRARSHLKASTTTSHSPTPSSWRRVGDLQPLPNKSLVQPKRRKMGPSHRQRKSAEDNQAGRVSVFCVGSGINLEELRAHVFRRSFSTNVTELALARKLDNHATNMDDDVLHVTNAPMLFSSYEWNDKHLQDTNNDAIDGENEAVDSARKHFEMLTMATQDIFYFDYGCVVFWGLSAVEEKAALKELEPFIIEPVSAVELENSFDTMEYVFDRNSSPQRQIKFDRFKLRTAKAEEKLALSYAMAQSSKLFVFEHKVLESVERTRYLPKELAKEGRIKCSKRELNRLIGQLFVEQTEVNLFSSILDSPDFLWDDDEYFSVYELTRSYLEVDDRVELLNSRLSVIRELLDVLTAQIADTNSTRLEWIAVWLIVMEIVMSIASSPLFAGKRVVSALLVPAAIWLYKKNTDTAEV